MSAVGLFALLTLLAAPPGPAAPPPRYEKGDELTYTGTVTETVDRVGNRLRRRHDLELRVLVLDRHASSVDAAVLTLLRRADDVVTDAATALAGGGPERTPPVVHLDLLRLGDDGSVQRLHPTRPLPAVPLDTFAASEFGPFPPRPADPLAPGAGWSRADADPARPPQSWRAGDPEFVTAERCVPLTMTQQTADWLAPRGGQTAWQRADCVWLSTRDGAARRVRRTIRQRDGTSPAPAAVVEVAYDLHDQTRLIGRAFDRNRREIEVAHAAAADAGPLLPDAVRLGPAPFEARLRRLDEQLEETYPGTPFREAALAVRRRLDAARRGEASPVAPASAVTVAPTPAAPPEVGQPAPDFLAAGEPGKPAARLNELRGKPVVLAFFQPGAKTADGALVVASALARKFGDTAAVLPLAIYAPAGAAAKQRDALALSLPVYDGAAAGTRYGVDTFPRFVVVDPDGRLAWEFRGYGPETGYLVKQQVERLRSPAPLAGEGSGARGAAAPAGDVPPPPPLAPAPPSATTGTATPTVPAGPPAGDRR